MTSTLLAKQLTLSQLQKFAALIYDKTGIRISERKITLVSNRLRRRLRANAIDCFDEYYKMLNDLPAKADEWAAFLQEITTHETYMFRDPTHWEWLRDVYLPGIQQEHRRGERDSTLRVWSAACSTGEEVYTIACCVADALNLSAWNVSILGTDIGVAALETARQGTYNDRAVRLVPETYKRRFLVKTPDMAWKVSPRITDLVSFGQHNLLTRMNGPAFDLVFVKNVLIYFDNDSKAIVMKHIMAALRPGGHLINGPTEGVSGFLGTWERTLPWLHRKPLN